MTPEIAYQLLEIEPGAGPELIREAYKDLAKVWHPDRYEHDPKLRARAEAKLKQINSAYQLLTEIVDSAAANSSEPSEAASKRPDSGQAGEHAGSSSPSAAPSEETTSRGAPKPAERPRQARRLASVVISSVVVVTMIVIGYARRDAARTTEPYVRASGRSYSYRPPQPEPVSTPVPPPLDRREPPRLDHQFFTIGSTREEVRAAQGAPTSIDRDMGEVWWYGPSRVGFHKGKVREWSTTPGATLRVAIQPDDASAATTAIARGYYTLGSSKSEVLALEGSPDGVDRSFGDVWWYEAAQVKFSNGKVTSWSSSAVRQLKADIGRANSTDHESRTTSRGRTRPKSTRAPTKLALPPDF